MMPPRPERNWCLVPLGRGAAPEAVALPDGLSTVGRDRTCALPLQDQSISRRHAEFIRENGDLKVRDLVSRNGVRVNGVPRLEALLQHGDLVEIGALSFQVSAGNGTAMPLPQPETEPEAEASQEPTRRQRLVLSKSVNSRSLSTLYHVCAWLADDLEEAEFTARCLRVLQEGMQACEVHLYEPRNGLTQWVCEGDNQRAFKFVPYLVNHFHELTEASCVPGKDIRKHQAAASQFNFLLGPLRLLQNGELQHPFVAVVRPVDWQEFTTADRILLQTICQLWVRAAERVRNVAALRSENAALKRRSGGLKFLGCSDELQRVRAAAVGAARTKITVTLLGETGSGKEVLAHVLHQESPRSQGPFIKVNCAAIPGGLIESELFGHVKGAFTDARSDHRGKFEQANGGTLFLDEIGELPLAIQSKFLRVLESGEVEKVGSEKPLTVDVRIIAASHRDLKQLVKERLFREDLFYRLNVITLEMPPLRDHLEDIDELAPHFLAEFCAENGLMEMNLTPAALERLKTHTWPGNVRELRNVMQRCAVRAGRSTLDDTLVASALA